MTFNSFQYATLCLQTVVLLQIMCLIATTEGHYYFTTEIKEWQINKKSNPRNMEGYQMSVKMSRLGFPQSLWDNDNVNPLFTPATPFWKLSDKNRLSEISQRIIDFVRTKERDWNLKENELIQKALITKPTQSANLSATHNKVIAFHGSLRGPGYKGFNPNTPNMDIFTVVLNEKNKHNINWCASHAIQQDQEGGYIYGYIYVLQFDIPPHSIRINLLDDNGEPNTYYKDVRGKGENPDKMEVFGRVGYNHPIVRGMYSSGEDWLNFPDSIIFRNFKPKVLAVIWIGQV